MNELMVVRLVLLLGVGYLLIGCFFGLYTLGRSMGAWRSWNKDAHAVLRLVEVLYALSLIVLWLPAIIVGMGIMKEAKNVGIGATQEEWDAAVDELKGKTSGGGA